MENIPNSRTLLDCKSSRWSNPGSNSTMRKIYAGIVYLSSESILYPAVAARGSGTTSTSTNSSTLLVRNRANT